MSLDLMYSYRNKYRKSMQDKNEKWIEQTDILLRVMNKLKCNFGDNISLKVIVKIKQSTKYLVGKVSNKRRKSNFTLLSLFISFFTQSKTFSISEPETHKKAELSQVKIDGD
ncbi:hypothetical protein M9Y10_016499 [Tritrichomonas musculus]|uniref:Uncharacterized protein n=1 Tax=Tritrichomonas musculus TaxID=1915356 RepID=A0ABR2HY31_9EUKA